jgi:hypothetical protein
MAEEMASRLTIEEVFTPGGNPSVTYVDREQLGLENKLRSALRHKHAFVVVSGPTKCGKSVLSKRVLRDRSVVTVQGGLVDSIEDFWKLISHQLRIPSSATTTSTSTRTGTWLLEASASFIGWIQGKTSATTALAKQRSQAANYVHVLSLDAIDELRRRQATLLIEDFHYIGSGIQRSIIRALRSAVFDGLQVVILAVPHRAFDLAEVEGEVEGRIEHIDIPNWSLEDLLEIPEKGFSALQLDVARNIQRRICEDGFGNPLLVQEICYEFSETRLRQRPNSTTSNLAAELAAVYNSVAIRKGLNRFDILTQAPAPEGAPVILLRDQTRIDLNNAILGAIARTGPEPTATLEVIRGSLEALTGGASIDREQVESALIAMTKAVAKGNSAPFEWEPNRAMLNISDPFLLFYLRWALKDRRTVILQPSAVDTARMLPPASSPLSDEDGQT